MRSLIFAVAFSLLFATFLIAGENGVIKSLDAVEQVTPPPVFAAFDGPIQDTAFWWKSLTTRKMV